MRNLKISVLVLMAGIWLGPAAMAEKQRLPKDKDLAASTACSSECGKKHGNGRVKGQPYDAVGYESCMIECMRQARGKDSKEAKN